VRAAPAARSVWLMAALLDVRPDACVRHVFAGSGYVLGRFDCPPGAERWTTVNWIGAQPHVVVPDTAVRLIPEGGETYVSTVNHVLVYDRDVTFRRQVVSADGDRCTFAILSDPLAAELGLGRPRRGRPRLRHGPSGARDYALAQAARAALAATDPDLLAVDEALLAVLRHAADRVDAPVPDRAGRTGTERAHREAVEAVKALLATDLPRRWTLSQLGAAVHYSPYCLARVFRARTGYPIAGYLRQLRLRASLPEATAPGTDLSTVATAYGFSSHSHYTRAFRQAFGRTPSQARRARQVLTR
jgi:AraC family transcriptional regulator